MSVETLTVSLGERSYDIFLGRTLDPIFPEWICRFFPGSGVFLVTDRNVNSIYGEDVRKWLAGIPGDRIVLPPGEEAKTWETVREIYAGLARGGAARDSLVVAFGGGVVGDLAGFAAATYLRGIPYVQIPTTLLAQVDSSVGGKTGFNLPEGKNLVGAFHQPRAVFIDPGYRITLDRRNLRAGMAEVVKCGLAGDSDLFGLLESRGPAWEGMEEWEWREVIRRSITFKAGVVQRDERESRVRRILNLGHTIGHAFEQSAGYGRLLHGEAVAIGLAWEILLGSRLGETPPDLADRVLALLLRMGYSLDDPAVSLPSLAAALEADKKRAVGEIDLPLAAGAGSCALRPVPVTRIQRELPSLREEVRSREETWRKIRLAERAEEEAGPPSEEVLLIPEGRYELRLAEEERGEAPGIPPVRTVTMASILWDQGERDEAFRIIDEILARDPEDPRALAWKRSRLRETEPEETEGEEVSALASFLESIRREYRHDVP